MEEGKMCGKLAVISWKHSGIPHLASKLGCSETDGCPLDYSSKTYDQVWEIKVRYQNGTCHDFRIVTDKYMLYLVAVSLCEDEKLDEQAQLIAETGGVESVWFSGQREF